MTNMIEVGQSTTDGVLSVARIDLLAQRKLAETAGRRSDGDSVVRKPAHPLLARAILVIGGFMFTVGALGVSAAGIFTIVVK